MKAQALLLSLKSKALREIIKKIDKEFIEWFVGISDAAHKRSHDSYNSKMTMTIMNNKMSNSFFCNKLLYTNYVSIIPNISCSSVFFRKYYSTG
jgi:hypothetical protein